jgi:hypothetical protein
MLLFRIFDCRNDKERGDVLPVVHPYGWFVRGKHHADQSPL